MRFQIALAVGLLAMRAHAQAPAAPANLTATIVSPTTVELRWDSVLNATSYDVRRNNITISSPATNAFTDGAAASASVQLYNVRAVGPGGTSAWSAVALAQTTTFTDATLIPRLTNVKSSHVLELRGAVNALRSAASLSPATFSDPTPTLIRATHVDQLRTFLGEARTALSLPALSYTHTLTPQVTKVRAIDIDELRRGVTGEPAEALFWNDVPVPAAVQSMTCSASHVFIGVQGNIRRSSDGGAGWSSSTGLPAGVDVAAVAYAGSGYVFAQTANSKIHGSADHGATWTELASTPAAFTTLLAAPNGLFALGGVCGGVWFSSTGATWDSRNSGITGCVTALARTNRGRLYAGTAANGVFISINDGTSWSAAGAGIPASNIHAIATDRDQRVFVATHDQGVFRSLDDGASWTSVAAGDFASLLADTNGVLLAGTETGARVHKEWSAASHGLPSSGAINALCSTHRHRFATTGGRLFRAPIEFRLHGLNFSPFIDGQTDVSIVGVPQLLQRMQIVRPHTLWLRSFRVTNGQQHIPRIAKTLGLKTMIGARITANLQQNETELAALIAIGQSGDADILAVGNEVLLPTPPLLPVATIVSYIQRVKAAVPGVPVTYVDGFHIWLNDANQTLRDAVDIVSASFYPFWDPNGVAIDDAIPFIDRNFQLLRAKVPGKTILVSEAGWPSADDDGSTLSATPANAAQHFREFESWARATRTSSFYFSAFDEEWKDEGGVGPHWGVWDSAGVLKPLNEPVLEGEWAGEEVIGGPGAPSIVITTPPDPSDGTFEGNVQHVVPNDHRVALYIRVGGGWWTKPFTDAPLTWIRGNGTWKAFLFTHPNDFDATEIAAYLLPSWYMPPNVANAPAIPPEIAAAAAASHHVARTP